jgi:hypothetical protein
VDGQLGRSLADMLCNVFSPVRIIPSIYYANVGRGLQGSSQCGVINGEINLVCSTLSVNSQGSTSVSRTSGTTLYPDSSS